MFGRSTIGGRIGQRQMRGVEPLVREQAGVDPAAQLHGGGQIEQFGAVGQLADGEQVAIGFEVEAGGIDLAVAAEQRRLQADIR